MYTQYWDLQSLPFENAPDPTFYFETNGHREAMVRLTFIIETHKALALITGDYGSGKTVLCQTVINKLSPDEFKCAFVINPQMDALDIIREIAYQLGEDIKSTSKYEVIHSINNLLDRHAAASRHCVAIIDEAQVITNLSVIEELRLLLNHQRAGGFLLTLILIGQTEFNSILRSLPQLTQRIGLKYHIPCMEQNEVREYMKHRLETAGSRLDIFREQAIVEVEKLSKGNPREINALCDTALLIAFLSGKKQVTAEDILDAARERVPL